MSIINRRTFLTGGLGAGLLAACGGGSDSAAPATTTTGAGSPAFLYPSFPVGTNDDSVTIPGSPQRITFVLRDEADFMRSNAPATANIVVKRKGVEIGGGQSTRHGDGIITPYYPVVFTPTETGRHEASLPDFPEVEPILFLVRNKSDVEVPLVGDQMRSVDTPTTDDHRGVEPICTRAVPCPFHDNNLADVLDNGRPTVLLIATPGFCQTEICGPVVDLLIDAAPSRPDIDFIHAEVYTDPSIFQTGSFPDTTPAVQINRLPFEPVVYVADSSAEIKSTLSTIWDRSELATALTAV